MDRLLGEWLQPFLEYGIAGLGWPLFLYALWDQKRRDERERDRAEKQHATDIDLIERMIAQTTENTHVLRQLVRMIGGRTEV